MKLIDLVNNINDIDEELIIFQKDLNDYDSDIVLSTGEGETKVTIEKNGGSFHYLIEVFLAKEFIEDWIKSQSHLPNSTEIAQRLYNYAINDA